METEMWGIADGLQVARDLQYNHVLLECDSLHPVELLSQPGGTAQPCAIVRHVAGLLDEDWNVSISRIPREANNLADGIVKLADANWRGRKEQVSVPFEIQKLYMDEVRVLEEQGHTAFVP